MFASGDPWLPRPFEVLSVSHETHDTVTQVIVPADGGLVPRYLPGQISMLGLPGVGEAPISISGAPSNAAALAHTLRMVGSVTTKLGKLRPGDPLSVRTPFGTGWPVDEAVGGDLAIIAGGIGIAPLHPVIQHVLANRDRYERVVLLYGARTPDDLVYRDQLDLLQAGSDVEVEITVDQDDEHWRGDVGMVTRLIGRAALDLRRTTVMVCGPEIMMRAVARNLTQRRFPADRIYVTMERNMQCAAGYCGHCQFGPEFVCKDGPVFPFPRVADLLSIPEV